jgi:serine phosphatase RsbU (regulator of sigma subunit)
LEARTTCEKQELLGEEGVQAAFCEAMAAGSTASEVALTLAEHTLEYASGILEDDLTFIVVRRLPLGR